MHYIRNELYVFFDFLRFSLSLRGIFLYEFTFINVYQFCKHNVILLDNRTIFSYIWKKEIFLESRFLSFSLLPFVLSLNLSFFLFSLLLFFSFSADLGFVSSFLLGHIDMNFYVFLSFFCMPWFFVSSFLNVCKKKKKFIRCRTNCIEQKFRPRGLRGTTIMELWKINPSDLFRNGFFFRN